MATPQDLLAAIKHVQSCTDDQNGWMLGLSEADIAMALTPTTGAPGRDAVLAKIHANHPTLFDPRTGAPEKPAPAAPVEPPPGSQPAEQQGAAATALKKAEDSLAQQNSSTSRLDLLVISAVLNAHAKTTEGADALSKLQREINDAVRDRIDLDTPAGARDFQRYLIGKLRQIGAVVDGASLEDTSKAALAGAWSALYEASKSADKAEEPETSAPPAAPAPPPASRKPGAAPEQAAPLPPYGVDTAAPLGDPWLPMDEGLPAEPAPTQVPPASAQPAQTTPASPPLMPTMPLTSSLPLPSAPGPPAPAPVLSGVPDEPAYRPATHGSLPDDPTLEELLADEGLESQALERGREDDEKSAEDSADDKETASGEKPPTESTAASTTVRLPDGDTITAPTPQIADAIRASLAGTPIGAAFAQQGIAIPPAGTAVADPIEPSKLVAGDIGMFTDRQALALDQHRALLMGRIEPLTRVSGPSFLGWLHPPDSGTAGSSTITPNGAAAPPPTRPATTAGYRS